MRHYGCSRPLHLSGLFASSAMRELMAAGERELSERLSGKKNNKKNTRNVKYVDIAMWFLSTENLLKNRQTKNNTKMILLVLITVWYISAP